MKHRYCVVSSLLIAAGTAAACADSEPGVLSLDATGSVAGVVYIDRDGNGELDSTDGPVEGVTVMLIPHARDVAAAHAASLETGVFTLGPVPVGRYDLAVDDASIPDSLRLARIDSMSVTVLPADTALTFVQLGYPHMSIAEARQAAVGQRVFIEGVALNAWSTFADSTVHVRDTAGAIRAVRVEPWNVTAGDSVRVLGTRSIQTGQPVLQLARLFDLGPVLDAPAPDTMSTTEAASALGGTADADLVTVVAALVTDTTRTADGEPRIIVDDGSGPLAIVLDQHIRFTSPLFPTGDPLLYKITATGLLVPVREGEWALKPRSNQEVILIPPDDPAGSGQPHSP
ncbi:MAG: hypothetical protein ACRELD_01090 [Longimicrobiales bacterium]